MLIALAGRKGSGKSLLANILVERGFKRLSFASYLKKIVAQIYDWDVKDLYNHIKKDEPMEREVYWNKSSIEKLSELTELDVENKNHTSFISKRDALTYIGTKVIREIDGNFHINKTLANINPTYDYVIDDLRFENELESIKCIENSYPIYVIRPSNLEYSNHPSEVSLDRKDFDYVLMNNSSKSDLMNKFDELLDCFTYGKNASKSYHPTVFSEFNKESAYWAGVISSTGCIKFKRKKVKLEITSSKEIVEGFVDFTKSEKRIVERRFMNGKIAYSFTTSCPYIIEDLKRWDNGDCVKDSQLYHSWALGKFSTSDVFNKLPYDIEQ